MSNKCLMLLSLYSWGYSAVTDCSDEVQKCSQLANVPNAQILLLKGIAWRKRNLAVHLYPCCYYQVILKGSLLDLLQ